MLLALLTQVYAPRAKADAALLSESEIEAAYLLSGVGENAGAYHAGMRVSANWNARQLSGWLRDKLENEMHSVSSMLSRASAELSALKEEDPAFYRQMTESEEGSAMVRRHASLMADAEDLRETMRFYDDRLQEYSAMIDQSTILMQSDTVYPEEVIRYSFRIRDAQAEIENIRNDIVQNAEAWEAQISQWQAICAGEPEGDAGMGKWLSAIFRHREPVAQTSVSLNAVTSGLTRLSRISSGGSVLKDDADQAVVTVLSDTQIGIVIQDQNNQGIEGVSVTLQDMKRENAKPVTMTTQPNGQILADISDFTVDDGGNLNISLEINADQAGYRGHYCPLVTIKKGTKYTENLEKDDGTPYLYRATFHGKDILRSEFQMLHSNLNDLDFDIVVQMKNTGGKPVNFCYQDAGGHETSNPGTVKDGIYTFTAKWKQLLSPDTAASVYTRLGLDEPRYPLLLKPIFGVTDAPTDLTDTLQDLGNLFAFSVTIPRIDKKVTFSTGLEEYMPKLSVDPMGAAVLTVGKNYSNLGKTNTEWKTKDMDDWEDMTKETQTEIERGKKKDNMGALAKNLEQRGIMFLGKAKLTLGWFLVFAGTWQKDPDDKTTHVALSGAIGGSVGFAASISFQITVGPVPLYLDLGFSLAAAAALGSNLDLLFVDGKYESMKFSIADNITIGIVMGLTVTVGAGFSGFFSIWIRGGGTFNFVFAFYKTRDPSALITFTASVELGVTLIIADFSMELWSGTKTLYDSTKSAYPLMEHYMGSLEKEGDENPGSARTPDTYPEIRPEAAPVLENLENVQGAPEYAELGGDMYAFFIQDSRLRWVNLSRNLQGSIADALKEAMKLLPADVPVDQMRDYDFGIAIGTGKQTRFGETKKIEDYFAVCALCAKELDDKGYPKAETGNAAIYTLNLWRAPDGSLIPCENGDSRQLGFLRAEWMGTENASVPDMLCEPEIVFADFPVNVQVVATVGIAYLEFAPTVIVTGKRLETDESAAEVHHTRITLGGKEQAFATYDLEKQCYVPRMDTLERLEESWETGAADYASGAGEEYAAVLQRFVTPRTAILLNRSETDSVLELYDLTMDAAEPSKRRSIPLTKGDIAGFTVLPGGDGQEGCTVFYADNASDDGETRRYRLRSLRMDPIQYGAAGSMTLNDTFTSYDIVLPGGNFRVRRSEDGLAMLYWISGAEAATDQSGLYRLNAAVYDAVTGAMSDDYVLAEFALDDAVVIRDAYLTASGTCYLLTGGAGDGKSIPPSGLYQFTVETKPVLELQAMMIEDLMVCPGDFDDVTVSVMNAGNMAATALTLELFVQDGEQMVSTGETMQGDLLTPENSQVKLNGETEITGEKAFYRLEDYDFAPKQQDCVVTVQTDKYTVTGGVLSGSEPGQPTTRYLKTRALLPGSAGAFKTSIRIPDDWKGKKTISLGLQDASSVTNWLRAMVLAAGAKASSDADGGEGQLIWTRDPGTGKMLLGIGDTSSGGMRVGREAGRTSRAGDASMHDLDVDFRVYPGAGGRKMLSIVILDHSGTGEPVHLYAELYVDDAETPVSLSLPYVPEAVSAGLTHTIDLPLDALVDTEQARKMRIVIHGSGITETAIANNEFTVYLNNASDPLIITKQPEDVVYQEGENVSFSVAAKGGVKPYSWHWEYRLKDASAWLALSENGEETVTLKNNSRAMDGCVVRCVVTDRSGSSAVSREAMMRLWKLPATGDAGQPLLYLAMILTAVAGMVVMMILQRRKRKE